MSGFTRDQKIAMLVVPVLLFGILGVSQSTGQGVPNRSGEIATRRTAEPEQGVLGKRARIREAIESENFARFAESLKGTAYEESATPEVFDTLMRMYILHTHGKHAEASEVLHATLYEA